MTRKNEAIWIESTQRWCIKVQQDGMRKAFYSSINGKKGKIAAEKKADEWLDNGGDPANVRFGEAWHAYLDETELLTSYSNYRQTEQIGRLWLLPSLKHHYVRNISDQDWQNCINKAYKKGKYLKTLKNIRGRIANFCKYAQKARYINHQPFDLRIPKDAPIRKKDILQPDAVKVLFANDTEEWHGRPRPAFLINAFRFLVVTGLRRGELCGLMKKDIDGDVLHINRAINDNNEITGGKNKNAIRTLVLGTHAKDIIKAQDRMLKELGVISPYLFPEKDGQHLKPPNFYQAWHRFCRMHGLYEELADDKKKMCDIQGLRRTMISLMKNDMPLDMMKRIVGHSKSMDTLAIYGREVDGELERSAQIIDDVFDKILADDPE